MPSERVLRLGRLEVAVRWRPRIRLGRRRLPPPTDTACEACGVIHPGYHKQWCPTIPADWFTEVHHG